jgi:hypothetical protein
MARGTLYGTDATLTDGTESCSDTPAHEERTILWKHVAFYIVRSSHQVGPNSLLAEITVPHTGSGGDLLKTWVKLSDRSILLRAADRYAYSLWKHCLFCRDCLERRDIYILLTFALLCWRRPVSPHRRSPCRFTGDHSVDHAQLVRLSPERGLFATYLKLMRCPLRNGLTACATLK